MRVGNKAKTCAKCYSDGNVTNFILANDEYINCVDYQDRVKIFKN